MLETLLGLGITNRQLAGNQRVNKLRSLFSLVGSSETTRVTT
jgi:hypothetical protein